MTFEKLGDVAHGVQDQLDDQIKQLTRWMKPYSKKMGKLSTELRPYGAQALDVARKHPGKTVLGAVLFGYLLSRFSRS
jgi:hypothetical protein